MKEKKGITLIALIITIVLLIIIAVVTVSSVKDYGIVDNANKVAKDWEQKLQNHNILINELNNETYIEKKCTHNWVTNTIITEATCTTAGEKEEKCLLCEETRRVTIAKTAHTWSTYSVTTEATCSTVGKKERTCENCGTTETATIAKTGRHTWSDNVQTIEANCQHGTGTTKTCTQCGTTETTYGTDVGNHIYKKDTGETEIWYNEVFHVAIDGCKWCDECIFSLEPHYSGMIYSGNEVDVQCVCKKRNAPHDVVTIGTSKSFTWTNAADAWKEYWGKKWTVIIDGTTYTDSYEWYSAATLNRPLYFFGKVDDWQAGVKKWEDRITVKEKKN